MKKNLFLVLLLVSSQSFAQDRQSKESTEQGYKANARNFTFEVNFNPFSSSPISINYLRFRKFVSSQNAWRLSGSINFRNQKPVENVTQSSFEINLRPGYEWHFLGTERLSPYVGFDVDFAVKSSSYSDDRTVTQNQGSISSISGSWDTAGTERGYTRIGSNVIIGVDYYLIRKLYLGFEIGYGFQLINSTDIIVTPRNGVPFTPTKGGTSLLIGPNYNSSIRLGFVF